MLRGRMVQIKPAEEIMADIKREYDKNPLDWRILRGRDARGHQDTYILGPSGLWRLKTELRAPHLPVGVGTKIDDAPMDIVRTIVEKGEYFPIGEIYPLPRKLSPPYVRRKPVSVKPKIRKVGEENFESAIIAVGFGRYSIESTRFLGSVLSEKQAELERNLNRNLEKLLDREGLLKEYI